jgi:hypothetical protein
MVNDISTGNVTRSDVIWCFQHFFGRQIDKEQDIMHFVNTEKDFRSLVTTLLCSAEYQQQLSRIQSQPPHIDGFIYEDSIKTQIFVLRVLALIKPQAVKDFRKIRVGNTGDGGYVMLDDFNQIEAAYSLGINDDVSWDKQISQLGIDIYQYDHTINKLPEENSKFHWFKIGIAEVLRDGFNTLSNLMSINGHTKTNNLLLKCDIEGHEWEMFGGLTQEQLLQFRQIVVETHGWQLLSSETFGTKIERAIVNLTANHRLVHVHANNHAAYSIVGGVALPAVLELTFVRIDDKQFQPTDETFPTFLDQPCRPGTADYALGHFRFQ